jgi:hypothetical protein
VAGLIDPPAARPKGNPTLVVLPAKTVLKQVHRVGLPVDAFNARAAPSRLTGVRFDALAGNTPTPTWAIQCRSP